MDNFNLFIIFFLDAPLTSASEKDEGASLDRLSAFKQISHMKQCLWKRWSQEFLRNLQRRQKWSVVVLIK